MRASNVAVGLALGTLLGWAGWSPPAQAGPKAASEDPLAVGRALFVKTWRPNDSRSRGGDGLGPLFNDTSCVACHNLGGTGGAGTVRHDVENLSFKRVRDTSMDRGFMIELGRIARTPLSTIVTLPEGSAVLHRSATSPQFAGWRKRIASQAARNKIAHGYVLDRSRRSTPALFGAGRIDAIPESVIEAAAKAGVPEFPEIDGRVCRLESKRIGRFGWKGQVESLEEFVLAACSVELGLEVPGHHQVTDPSIDVPKEPKGLDLSADDCASLVAFVRSLPAPVVQRPMPPTDAEDVAAGSALFQFVGCASCHSPSLGDVDGLYSDLLLHDMGSTLVSVGGGYSGTPVHMARVDPPLRRDKKETNSKEPEVIGARPNEWRTPPLWGVADSAPYLHDGRAPTLHDAILTHDGEASRTVKRYLRLSEDQKDQLAKFLLSLTAPTGVGKGLHRPASLEAERMARVARPGHIPDSDPKPGRSFMGGSIGGMPFSR